MAESLNYLIEIWIRCNFSVYFVFVHIYRNCSKKQEVNGHVAHEKQNEYRGLTIRGLQQNTSLSLFICLLDYKKRVFSKLNAGEISATHGGKLSKLRKLVSKRSWDFEVSVAEATLELYPTSVFPAYYYVSNTSGEYIQILNNIWFWFSA